MTTLVRNHKLLLLTATPGLGHHVVRMHSLFRDNQMGKQFREIYQSEAGLLCSVNATQYGKMYERWKVVLEAKGLEVPDPFVPGPETEESKERDRKADEILCKVQAYIFRFSELGQDEECQEIVSLYFGKEEEDDAPVGLVGMNNLVSALEKRLEELTSEKPASNRVDGMAE